MRIQRKVEIDADILVDQLRQTVAVLTDVAQDSELHATLIEAARETVKALKAGRKLMVAGNGGSAADAQHVVAELVSRLVEDRSALRAIALTTDSSILTAVGTTTGTNARSSAKLKLSDYLGMFSWRSLPQAILRMFCELWNWHGQLKY